MGLEFVQFGVFVESSFEIVQGNDKSWPSVQDAPFEDVHVEKRPEAMEQGRPKGAVAASSHCKFLGPQRRIFIGFVEKFFQSFKRKLPDRIAQIGYRPFGDKSEILV